MQLRAEKFYSCVLKETITILQQTKLFKFLLPPERKYSWNNFRAIYNFKRKQKAAILD